MKFADIFRQPQLLLELLQYISIGDIGALFTIYIDVNLENIFIPNRNLESGMAFVFLNVLKNKEVSEYIFVRLMVGQPSPCQWDNAWFPDEVFYSFVNKDVINLCASGNWRFSFENIDGIYQSLSYKHKEIFTEQFLLMGLSNNVVPETLKNKDQTKDLSLHDEGLILTGKDAFFCHLRRCTSLEGIPEPLLTVEVCKYYYEYSRNLSGVPFNIIGDLTVELINDGNYVLPYLYNLIFAFDNYIRSLPGAYKHVIYDVRVKVYEAFFSRIGTYVNNYADNTLFRVIASVHFPKSLFVLSGMRNFADEFVKYYKRMNYEHKVRNIKNLSIVADKFLEWMDIYEIPKSIMFEIYLISILNDIEFRDDYCFFQSPCKDTRRKNKIFLDMNLEQDLLPNELIQKIMRMFEKLYAGHYVRYLDEITNLLLIIKKYYSFDDKVIFRYHFDTINYLRMSKRLSKKYSIEEDSLKYVVGYDNEKIYFITK